MSRWSSFSGAGGRDLNLPSALNESALCSFLGRGVQMCLDAFKDEELRPRTVPLYVGTPPRGSSFSYRAEASVLGLLFGISSDFAVTGVVGQHDLGTRRSPLLSLSSSGMGHSWLFHEVSSGNLSG